MADISTLKITKVTPGGSEQTHTLDSDCTAFMLQADGTWTVTPDFAISTGGTAIPLSGNLSNTFIMEDRNFKGKDIYLNGDGGDIYVLEFLGLRS